MRRFTLLLILISGSPLANAAIFVENIRPDYAAYRAGVPEEAVFGSWRAGEQVGEIRSVFDLWYLTLTVSPRTAVTLSGTHVGKDQEWTVPPATPWGPLWKTWGIRVRPALEPRALTDYQAGLVHYRDDDQAEAITYWEHAADQTADPDHLAWLWLRIAEVERERKAWGSAENAFARALAAGERAGSPVGVAMIRSAIARMWSLRNNLDEAEAQLKLALEQLPRPDKASELLAAHLRYQQGLVVNNRGDVEISKGIFEEVLAVRKRLAPDSLHVADSLNELASVAKELGNLDESVVLANEALALLEVAEPGGLAAGKAHNTLGRVALERGRLTEAEAAFELSARIHEQLLPESRDFAAAKGNLAIISIRRGDFETADKRMSAVLEIFERTEPGGAGVAQALNNLGFIARRRSELELAQQRYARSLEISEVRSPNGAGVAAALTGLSAVLSIRGNLAEAEQMRRRAVEIRQRQVPGSIDLARSWLALGEIVHRRGDFAAAQSHYARALEIIHAKAPGSQREAVVLNNLALLAMRSNDLDLAQSQFEAALKMLEEEAPNTTETAAILTGLGQLHRKKNEADNAKVYFEKALAIQTRIAPGALRTAWVMHQLGTNALDQERYQLAYRHHEQALTIRRNLAPGTSREVQSMNGLGRVLFKQGKVEEATPYLCGATAILDKLVKIAAENQQDRAQYRSQYTDYYRDCVDALVEQGQTQQAFNALEQSRAQFLRTLIAERDLDFGADLPAELNAAYRKNRAQLDSEIGRLTSLATDQSDQRQVLRNSIAELDQQRRQLLAEIRASAPRIADIQDPKPIQAQMLNDNVDPGTVVLSFSVGTARTIVFAYDADSQQLSHFTVPISRESLTEEIQKLRNAIGSREHRDLRFSGSPAHALAQTLLAPAQSLLTGAARVLICPDGPLHELPFSALVTQDGQDDGPLRYLVESVPVHRAFSVSLYQQFRKLRTGTPAWSQTLLAFGDPDFASAPPGSDNRSAAAAPAKLPFTREEVQSVARLYPGDASVYLGAEATELNVKTHAPSAPLLHLASHALVDDQLPLNSAVILSTNDGSMQNGYLTALEVFEDLRLQSELVTLSACETGLGSDMGNEGMLGLVSAFQFAGAQTVLASLWKVSDQGTADLMRQFYAGLKAGLPKDQALRSAQLAMLDGNRPAANDNALRAIGGLVQADIASHSHEPFFWAAFELFGNWE